MSEQYSKVEVVRAKLAAEEWAARVFGALLMIAILTLISWWFLASWFPEFGFTYWQLVLPVFLARLLFGTSVTLGRQLK